MTNSPSVRTVCTQTVLNLIPPMMRDTLLEDVEFWESYGINTNVIISFGNPELSFQRSALFDSIRKVFLDETALEVIDTTGRKWELDSKDGDDDIPVLVISSHDQNIILPDFTFLSQDKGLRLRAFERASSRINLSDIDINAWMGVLEERALEDNEVDKLQKDIHDTPVYVAERITNDIRCGESSVSSLVPGSRRYYERLIGRYDGSRTIQDYSKKAGKQHLETLSKKHPYEGFLFSLFLSSHSSITEQIPISNLSREELVRVFEYIDERGDRISQIGAIEIGLRLLGDMPELEKFIIRLICQVRDDAVSEGSGFKLLSALFVLVDGELARSRLFSKEPPFYRRLASLSHAALIHRQINELEIVDVEQLFEWVFENRGMQYYYQSFADMRVEPRWNPDLADATQMNADFIGRILIAANKYKDNIVSNELKILINGEEEESLNSHCEFPYPFLPSPLEGGEHCQNKLPNDISQAIKEQLSSGASGPCSFIVLVNSAQIFSLESNQADLAVEVLKQGGHRLAGVENESQLLSTLYGLATVAAVTRSQELASELRILARVYRRDIEYRLSIEGLLRICLVASASNSDLKEWRNFVGDWITEMAFEDFNNDEAELIHSGLQCLVHSVPELWISCGKADAALKAYLGI